MRKVVIGTRGSALALKQTDLAAEALKTLDPALEVEVRVIQTHGDINQQPIPLDTIGKGWFTKEIEGALLKGEIDLAVHSLKDMAEEMPQGLIIGAYLSREDARDALVTKHGEPLELLKPGAIVGTDSARRQVQMLGLRPDLTMESLRGNVPTRLEKLDTGEYDAIILAAAGLKRLGLESRITRYFEPTEMTPAPGQGTLAVQVAEKNEYLRALLTRINDPNTSRAAHIERSFSRVMGGGCKSPTGAYAFRTGAECCFIGMIADGAEIVRKEARAPWEKSTGLGEELAAQLLSQRKNHGPQV